MDLLIWFQALPYILLFLNWYFHLFNQAWLCILLLLVDPFFSHFLNIELGEFYDLFRSKPTDLLVLGSDEYKRSVILNLSDEDERLLGENIAETPPYSRLSSMGRIRFNLSDFGELRTACRVWKDYCAKRGAIVYVVNAGTSEEQFSGAREDLRDLLSDEDFINVPFLIFCEPSYLSEKELCFRLGLTDRTTGKGRVRLQAGTRPLEVFVAEPSNRKQHQDAIKWLSQYIK